MNQLDINLVEPTKESDDSDNEQRKKRLKQKRIQKPKGATSCVRKRSLKATCRSHSMLKKIQAHVKSLIVLNVLGRLNVRCTVLEIYHGDRNKMIEHFTQTMNKNSFGKYFRSVQEKYMNPNAQTSGGREMTNVEIHPTVQKYYNEYNVNWPSTERMGGILDYAAQSFTTEFKNAICVHSYRRIKNFLTMMLKENDFSDKDGAVYRTLKFLFGKRSKDDEYEVDVSDDDDSYSDTGDIDGPHTGLIDLFVQILCPINFSDGGSDYFKSMHRQWYINVPLFLRLQEYIANRNAARKFQNSQQRVPLSWNNFSVIPVSKFKRRSLKIDNKLLIQLLKDEGELKSSTTTSDITDAQFDHLWRQFFNIAWLERPNAPISVHFDQVVVTNGVSSFFQCYKIVNGDIEHLDTAAKRTKYLHADQKYFLDPGRRMPIAGVRENTDNTKTSIRTGVRQFKRITNYRKREHVRNRLTRVIGEKMRADRELVAEQFGIEIGPRSHNYVEYTKHCLKFMNEAIEAYGHFEYALQDFIQYKDTHQAMSNMAKKYINGMQTFVGIGGADNYNTPIKGYALTPRNLLLRKMGEHPLCAVMSQGNTEQQNCVPSAAMYLNRAQKMENPKPNTDIR